MPVSFFMVRRRVPSRMACTCKLKSSKAEAPATMCRIVVARRERDAVNSVVGYRARCRQQVARYRTIAGNQPPGDNLRTGRSRRADRPVARDALM